MLTSLECGELSRDSCFAICLDFRFIWFLPIVSPWFCLANVVCSDSSYSRRLTCTIHTSTGMETCRISHWTVLYLKDQSVSNSQSPHRTQRCSMDSQWPENLRISLSSTNGSRPDGVVSPSKPVELLLSLLNANSSVMAWSSCGLLDPAKTAITISWFTYCFNCKGATINMRMHAGCGWIINVFPPFWPWEPTRNMDRYTNSIDDIKSCTERYPIERSREVSSPRSLKRWKFGGWEELPAHAARPKSQGKRQSQPSRFKPF